MIETKRSLLDVLVPKQKQHMERMKQQITTHDNAIKGIIFDFDGVIASFEARFGWPFFNALKATNPNITKDILTKVMIEFMDYFTQEANIEGIHLVKLLFVMGKKLGMTSLKVLKLLIRFGLYYKKNKSKIVPILGVREVLQSLLKQKYKVVLITNSSRKTIEYAKSIIPELHQFNLIITKDEVKYSKPHPSGFVQALEVLGLQAKEVISIGDQASDIIVAKNLGIKSIAFAGYYSKYIKPHLKEYQPNFILTDIRDLLGLLSLIQDYEGFSESIIDFSIYADNTIDIPKQSFFTCLQETSVFRTHEISSRNTSNAFFSS